MPDKDSIIWRKEDKENKKRRKKGDTFIWHVVDSGILLELLFYLLLDVEITTFQLERRIFLLPKERIFLYFRFIIFTIGIYYLWFL